MVIYFRVDIVLLPPVQEELSLPGRRMHAGVLVISVGEPGKPADTLVLIANTQGSGEVPRERRVGDVTTIADIAAVIVDLGTPIAVDRLDRFRSNLDVSDVASIGHKPDTSDVDLTVDGQ